MPFLADGTNGRTYDTVLCLSVPYLLWRNSTSCRKTVWRSK